MTTAVKEHTDWSLYADGTESGSVIVGAKNTNPTKGAVVNGTIYLYRAGIHESNGGNWMNATVKLQYSHEGGGLVDVNATSAVVQIVATGNIADGADTTQRMTAFTFDGSNEGFDEVDGVAGGGSADISNSGFEALWSIQIIDSAVSDDDTIVLKVVQPAADLDQYNQTDPTITVIKAGAAEHSITGDVTVTPSIASAMQFQLNASVAGATTVIPAVAATMVFQLNASITSDITILTTIAATMVITQPATILGDITITPAVASVMNFDLNASLAGTTTVTLAVAGAMRYQLNASVAGATTVIQAISATMEFQLNASVAGTTTITPAINAVLNFSQVKSITGDITITPSISAAMIHTSATPAVEEEVVDYTKAPAWFRSTPVSDKAH